jgi:hypothetical protein
MTHGNSKQFQICTGFGLLSVIRETSKKTFQGFDIQRMILFIHTCPWAAKIWTLVMTVVSDFVVVPSPNMDRYRYVFGMVCLATLSSVLPSLMYSTSNHRLTTSYVMQSCLYLTDTHTLLELLTTHSQQHCVLVTYLLLCHFLSGQIYALRHQLWTAILGLHRETELRTDMHFVDCVPPDMPTSVHERSMDDSNPLSPRGSRSGRVCCAFCYQESRGPVCQKQ